jgi:pre-mRNA-splicing factor ATP-dependent RNA helicase DHX38/PRP16
MTSYNFNTNYRGSTDTPLPTPTHRYNAWADDRKTLGITPRPSGGGEGGDEEEEVGGVKFKTNKEKEEWEEEQKVRGQL